MIRKVLLLAYVSLVASTAAIAGKYARLETTSKIIYDICFSSSGEVLAVADDNTVKFFDFAQRKLFAQLEGGHQATILSIDFSADSTLLASGDRQGVVRVWDVYTRTIKHTLNLEGEAVTGLSLGGDYLAVATAENRVVLLNVVTGLVDKEFTRGDDVLIVRFNPEGTLLAAGAADNIVEIYDIGSMQVVNTLYNHKNWVRALDFSWDGTRFATGDDNGRILIWNKNETDFIKLKTFRTGFNWITSLQYMHDRNTFAASTSSGAVILYTPFIISRKNLRVMIHKVRLKPNKTNSITAVVATMGKGVVIIEGKEF